jgi:HK97 family phage major capsid protein
MERNMSKSALEQVRERLSEIAPEMKRLAGVERAHTEVEAARYNALVTEFDALEAREAELVEHARRAGLAAGAYEASGRPGSGSAARDAALRGAERQMAKFGVDNAAERMTAIERAIKSDETNGVARFAAATGDPDYASAFFKVLRDPEHGEKMWTPEEQRAFQRVYAERAMAEGTGSTGGYVVPLFVDQAIVITGTGAAAAIRSVANVKTITTQTYNGATAGQVTASVLAENAAFPDGTPALAQVQIPTYKMGAYIQEAAQAA